MKVDPVESRKAQEAIANAIVDPAMKELIKFHYETYKQYCHAGFNEDQALSMTKALCQLGKSNDND